MAQQTASAAFHIALEVAFLLLQMLRPEEQTFAPDDLVLL
jgi:hypothetical protein